MVTPHTKRCAITGTAPSWRKTPFTDQSLEIWGLNDAYSLGWPRASRWFEQHPLDEFWFRPKDKHAFTPDEIPKLPDGRMPYIRPVGHIEWLKDQATRIPVYLQKDPPDGWPINAKRFPLEVAEQVSGLDYWASGPSYMLALALHEGYTEIHVYGIHLATEQEYREQRPQWEAMLGQALGLNVKKTVKDGLRIYDGNIRLVLPVEAPILQHPWKYAYEPRPVRPDVAAQARLKQYAKQHRALIEQLVMWPRWKSKRKPMTALKRMQALIRDAQMEARHAVIAAGR